MLSSCFLASEVYKQALDRIKYTSPLLPSFQDEPVRELHPGPLSHRVFLPVRCLFLPHGGQQEHQVQDGQRADAHHRGGAGVRRLHPLPPDQTTRKGKSPTTLQAQLYHNRSI